MLAYQAQSMATPRKRKILYSIHENGNPSLSSRKPASSSAVGSSAPVRGSYSEASPGPVFLLGRSIMRLAKSGVT